MKNYILTLLLLAISASLFGQKNRLEKILTDAELHIRQNFASDLERHKVKSKLLMVCIQPFHFPKKRYKINESKIRILNIYSFHRYLRFPPKLNKKYQFFFFTVIYIMDNKAKMSFSASETNKKLFNVHYLTTARHREKVSHFYFFSGSGEAIAKTANLENYGLEKITKDSIAVIQQFWYSQYFNQGIAGDILNFEKSYKTHGLNPYEWKQSFKEKFINKREKKGELQIQKGFWEYVDSRNENTTQAILPIAVAWLHKIHLDENEWRIEYLVGYVYTREQKTVELTTPYNVRLHFK